MAELLGLAVVALTYGLLRRRRQHQDTLTGLPTQAQFLSRVQQALQRHQRATSPDTMAVVFVGIDRLKVINETLGHLAGDQLLQLIAQRLRQRRTQPAFAARIGGGEFALLLESCDRNALNQALDQFQSQLSEPLHLPDRPLPNLIHMGVAIPQPGYQHTALNLLRDAHTAMYRAKTLGKSRYEIFTVGMLTEAVNRLRLESDLLTALDKQEFLLYYQPIVSLSTGQIAGFEALLRWKQRERGFVLPSTFIPIAEDTGLILPLGRWVFRAACRQLKLWQNAFPQQPLTMSINLSNRQLDHGDLLSQIAADLAETQLSGHQVRLEITESIVLGDVDAAIDLMLQLKSLDLQLALDDFGTGYSSLSYLHRLPIDTLKMDKSFIGRIDQSEEDRAIAHTILSLGQQLGMEVVAEGLETSSQIAVLQAAACSYGQGYVFAPPLPAAAATELLRQRWLRSPVSDPHP